MRAFGITAEFNPFHEGHRYVIEQGRTLTGCDICVCVMSGNFVQRGGPAVFSKWKRAEAALRGGADLVIELPAVYAVSSAETFAEGAVRTLLGTGAMDFIVFGSESGDGEALAKAAEVLAGGNGELDELIRSELKTGTPYHTAFARAGEALGIPPEIISQPNDILGLQYIRALMEYKREHPDNTTKAVSVKRTGAGHHESASEIRKELRRTDGRRLDDMENRYFDLVRAKILTETAEKLERIASAGEGLGNKLKKEVRAAESLDELIERVKSKRYPYTRISRLLCQTLLGLERGGYADFVTYIRPLAMNEKGAAYLKHIKKTELNSIQIIDKIGRDSYLPEDVQKVMDRDILASDLYNIIAGEDLYGESDFVKKLIIVR